MNNIIQLQTRDYGTKLDAVLVAEKMMELSEQHPLLKLKVGEWWDFAVAELVKANQERAFK